MPDGQRGCQKRMEPTAAPSRQERNAVSLLQPQMVIGGHLQGSAGKKGCFVTDYSHLPQDLAHLSAPGWAPQAAGARTPFLPGRGAGDPLLPGFWVCHKRGAGDPPAGSLKVSLSSIFLSPMNGGPRGLKRGCRTGFNAHPSVRVAEIDSAVGLCQRSGALRGEV